MINCFKGTPIVAAFTLSALCSSSGNLILTCMILGFAGLQDLINEILSFIYKILAIAFAMLAHFVAMLNYIFKHITGDLKIFVFISYLFHVFFVKYMTKISKIIEITNIFNYILKKLKANFWPVVVLVPNSG